MTVSALQRPRRPQPASLEATAACVQTVKVREIAGAFSAQPGADRAWRPVEPGCNGETTILD